MNKQGHEHEESEHAHYWLCVFRRYGRLEVHARVLLPLHQLASEMALSGKWACPASSQCSAAQ
jgi:hypothetical protein